jgi:small conductance mechanosensitive channel
MLSSNAAETLCPRSAAALFAAIILFVGSAVSAQEAVKAEPQALAPKDAQRLEALVEEVEVEKDTIRRLTRRLDLAEGLIHTITQERLDRTWTALFQSAIRLADLASEQEKAGYDVSAFRQDIVSDLTKLPEIAFELLERAVEANTYVMEEMSIIDQVKADQELLAAIDGADQLYRVLIEYISVAPEFGLDVAEIRDTVISRLADSAENRAIFLDMSNNGIVTLRASVAILPANEELQGRLSAAEARVRLIAASMKNLIGLMSRLGMDGKSYRKQILTTTGEITTDVLDVGIVAILAAEWGKAIMSAVAQKGPLLLFRLFLVLLVFFVFAKLSGLVRKLVGRGLDSGRVRISRLLRRMIVSTAGNLVFFIGILFALSQLGISLGPLLAGLGIAGFIIGFAMQDTLANFASGMLILMYKPFDVGDVVEAGGVHGKVSSMSLVNTTIMTLDNQTLVVPNNLIWGSVIKNVTAQRTRRIDLVFGIAYGDDIEKAEKVFADIVESHEKTLDHPEPIVRVHELADSSVNFVVRPWVKTDDYWEVYWDLTRAVKLGLDKAEISIPFPQRDVHVYKNK